MPTIVFIVTAKEQIGLKPVIPFVLVVDGRAENLSATLEISHSLCGVSTAGAVSSKDDELFIFHSYDGNYFDGPEDEIIEESLVISDDQSEVSTELNLDDGRILLVKLNKADESLVMSQVSGPFFKFEHGDGNETIKANVVRWWANMIKKRGKPGKGENRRENRGHTP